MMPKSNTTAIAYRRFMNGACIWIRRELESTPAAQNATLRGLPITKSLRQTLQSGERRQGLAMPPTKHGRGLTFNHLPSRSFPRHLIGSGAPWCNANIPATTLAGNADVGGA